MITNEQLKDFISRSYSTAKNHGFFDKEISNEHQLMLVLSEVGEAVNADRKMKRADMAMFERESNRPQDTEHDTQHWQFCYEQFIKDTVECELADVAIRLFSLCGSLGIEPTIPEHYQSVKEDFVEMCSGMSFCERCFLLSSIICHCDGNNIGFDGSEECIQDIVSYAIVFLFFMADDMGINLIQYIKLKMDYNVNRPNKNGKLY